MKSKSVLVVSGNQEEVEVIRTIFKRGGGRISLASVNNGREALDALMGGFRGLRKIGRDGKSFRPDVILIDKDLEDMSAFEFLGIIKKYYTLSQIKSYLLTDAVAGPELDIYQPLVTGYIRRPIKDNPDTFEKLHQLTAELREDQRAALPFIGIATGAGAVKGKLFAVKTALSFFKVAACVAGATIVTVAAVAIAGSEKKPEGVLSETTVVSIVQPDLIADTTAKAIVDTMQMEPIQEPASVIIPADQQTQVIIPNADTVEAIAEEMQTPDSVQAQKKLSIGVKPGGGTR